MNWDLRSGLGADQVSGDQDRSEKSVGIAVLAYLFVMRACHHEIVHSASYILPINIEVS